MFENVASSYIFFVCSWLKYILIFEPRTKSPYETLGISPICCLYFIMKLPLFVLAFYYVLYSLIVWGYKLFNIILSCLLLRTFNTHIRVMTNALVWIIINLFYVLLFIVSHWDVCNRYCLRLVGEMRDYIYIQLPL